MTNLELADKLQKESEHFSGAQDLVGMLWDAGAALRNLHTENTALRVTEDNLRQELQECQDQRRAAFRRIEELDRELDAMRAQIGQGVPGKEGDLLTIAYLHGFAKGKYAASAHPAPQQKPLTDEQIVDAYCKERGMRQYVEAYVAGARFAEAAHNIGEKK